MSKRDPDKVEMIPADAYPQVLARLDAAQFLTALKSNQVKDRVGHVIKAGKHALSDAVRLAAGRLDGFARDRDMPAVLAEAYEIRSLAETAGLTASGRIAAGLCFYLNAIAKTNTPADPAIVTLHVDAIARAAHARDEATRLGTEVTAQLRALVHDKLGPTAPSDPGNKKRGR